jgi:hypothetical protein
VMGPSEQESWLQHFGVNPVVIQGALHWSSNQCARPDIHPVLACSNVVVGVQIPRLWRQNAGAPAVVFD